MIQHFIQTKQGIVGNNNQITLTFDPPPQGYTMTGAVTIYGSVLGIRWNILRSGQVVDTTIADVTASNIQCSSNDIITVTALNIMAPGTVVQASYTGWMDDSSNVPPVTPSNDSISVATVQQLLDMRSLSPGTTTYDVFIPPGVNQIKLIGNINLNDIISITDTVTGTVYYNSNTGLGGAFNPISVDVAPNSVVAISYNNSQLTAVEIAVVGYDTGPKQLSTSSQPVFTRNRYDGLACSNFNTTSATGTTTALLSAPAANNVWQVQQWSINAGTTAADATKFAVFQGTSTGNFIVGTYAMANGTWLAMSSENFTIGEGISARNAMGINVAFNIWAREIPVWFA